MSQTAPAVELPAARRRPVATDSAAPVISPARSRSEGVADPVASPVAAGVAAPGSRPVAPQKNRAPPRTDDLAGCPTTADSYTT